MQGCISFLWAALDSVAQIIQMFLMWLWVAMPYFFFEPVFASRPLLPANLNHGWMCLVWRHLVVCADVFFL